MKESDIAIIILVVASSLLISFFIGGSFLASPESRTKEIPVVEPINNRLSNVADEEYRIIFYNRAINPAVNIDIGESDTDKPFIDN